MRPLCKRDRNARMAVVEEGFKAAKGLTTAPPRYSRIRTGSGFFVGTGFAAFFGGGKMDAKIGRFCIMTKQTRKDRTHGEKGPDRRTGDGMGNTS